MNRSLEFSEVFAKIGSIDLRQRSVHWHTNSQHPEVSLETRIDNERARELVHSTNHESTLNLQQLDALGQIIPMVVVFDLSQKSNSTLSIVRIKLRHVQIVDEVDECVLSNGAIPGSSLLLKLSHEAHTKRGCISVVVHVDGLAQIIICLLGEFLQKTFDHLCLTATSLAHKEWAVTD